MARRISPAQARAELQRARQRRQQAVNKANQAIRNYNSAARQFNADQKRAVDNYNRGVRAQNQRVRTNRDRLRRELTRLQAAQTTQHVTYRQSVDTLVTSWETVERSAATGRIDDVVLDLTDREAANSVAALNALEAPTDDDTEARLSDTTISDELIQLDEELDRRWRGALFSLHADNPDAARHFCTSAREILIAMLDRRATDAEITAVFPDAERTQQGTVSRRARIRFYLHRRGTNTEELAAFVDEDVTNVLSLFNAFNGGTHGNTGRYTLHQLGALKQRVEDAIVFLHQLLR